MKIIQLAVALNNEGDESLYALRDDGMVMQRRWAAKPRAQRSVDGITYHDGWTEGWVLVEDGWSTPIKHPDDVREES